LQIFNMIKKWLSTVSFKVWFVSIAERIPFIGAVRKHALLKLPSPEPTEPEDVPKQYAKHDCPNYMDLKMRFRDVGRMNAIIETLGRDFLTAMPEGAYKSRLGQISFLSRRMHEDLVSKEVAELIEKARAHQQKSPDDWDEWDSSNLYEMETMYRHSCRIDSDLIEKRANLAYEGRRRHRAVLRDNDWGAAKGFLQETIDIQREIAESKCLIDNEHGSEAAYQALMREYIPGARLNDIDRLFGDYKKKLDNLLPQIIEKQKSQEKSLPVEGPFPSDLQLWLNKSLLKVIGFDFERGGLYETGHNPVEGGTPDDTRLVIKTSDTGNFLESMKSTLHEGGHGLYIQGLPRTQWRYQPVGQDLGAAVQESQALLVEMILGRMPEFFEYLSPRVEGLFQKFGDPALSARNLYSLKTKVHADIDRKHADEVTYFYHINMRVKLERQLISGKLKVKDLPDAWNAEVKIFTGKEPQTHAQGCLQDVHWFVGKFGYYPAYTLGHMMAAQMNARMKQDIQNLPELISQGQLAPIRNWLNTHIHAKGRLQRTDKLLKDVTGQDLTFAPLLNHLEERYLNAA
jgi:carboxypeptidase Taq